MQIIIVTIREFLVDIRKSKEIYLEKFLRLLIYAGVFFIPIFYFPSSSQAVIEYSKVIFFYLFIIVCLATWLVKVFISKKINLGSYFLDIPFFLFLLVYFLASIFSTNRWLSFLGDNLAVSFSLLTVAMLIVFYLFISRYINSLKEIINIFNCLVISFFIISAIHLLTLLPITIPFTLNGFSISNFSLILLLGFLISLILSILSVKKIKRNIFIFLSLYFLAYLFILDKPQVLLILILSIFSLIVLLSLKSEKFSEKLVVWLTAILFICILASILPINKLTKITSVNELSLPEKLGWEITAATLEENLLLGAGPQNFISSFYQYKPLTYNESNLWQFSFTKNSNFWLETLNNTGLLGLLLLLVIIFKYVANYIKFVRRLIILDDFTYRNYLINCGLMASLIVLILFGFFYNFTFICFFFFLLFLAIGTNLLQNIKPENILSDKRYVNFFVYVFVIVLVCIFYMGGKLVLADIYCQKALALSYADDGSFAKGSEYLEQAIRLNNNTADYYIKLARLKLNKIKFLVDNQLALDDSTLVDKLNNNLEKALSKENLQANSYQEIFQIYKYLNDLGLDSAEKLSFINDKLLELDKFNPELYIDRALLNFDNFLLIKEGKVSVADAEKELSFLKQEIFNDLNKSLELKPNYVLGYYNLGLFYEELGDSPKALENIEKSFALDPSQQIIALSLKNLYLNQDKDQQAMDVLNKYLEYSTDDTQMMSELLNIYQDNNLAEKAKEQAEKILAIDPQNEEAKKFLSQ